jgi:PAS domain S-box-containing protein
MKPVLHFAYPVLGENSEAVKAILIASFNLEAYGQFFSRAQLPEGSVLSLTDPTGIRLYRYPLAEKYSGNRDLPSMMEKMSGPSPEGTFIDIGVDGVQRLYAFKRVSVGEGAPTYFLRVGIRSDIVVAKAERVHTRNLVLFGIAGMLALACAWIFGEILIVRRLNTLVSASVRLGSGDLRARTGLSGSEGELGKLARNFDEMAEALEHRESDRKIAVNLLQEQIEIQKALLFSMPALVYVKDKDCRYQLGNAHFSRLVGLETDEIPGRCDEDLFPPGMAMFFKEIDTEVMENGSPKLGIELSIESPEGDILWLSSNKAPFHDAEGTVIGLVCISIDITDLKKGEKALRDSEERLKLVLEGSSDGFWDWDMVNGTVEHSARWAEILGYRAEDLNAGVDEWQRLVHPDDMPAIRTLFKEHLAGRMTQYRAEYRMLNKSGGWTWILDRGKVVEWDAAGKPLRMAGTATDITELKLAEFEKQELASQLRQAQKLEAIGQLTGGIAHDFNNILTAIIGYSHLLLTGMSEDHRLRGFAEQILASADRAAGLTQSLLAFSRKQVIKPQPADLNDLVVKIDKLLCRLIGEDIELRTSIHQQPLFVMADTGQVEQVLMNLATNARDAMPNGGVLSISTGFVCAGDYRAFPLDDDVDYARLVVTDSGTGMDESVRERIFEPFFTTKEVGKGTGLGLSMVYGIIEQHKGHIRVESGPGKGTTFEILLPASGPGIQRWTSPAQVPNPLHGSETVLIAEDEDDVRIMARNLLQSYGYAVIEAEDGKDAVFRFIQDIDKIDLIIMDLIMPKMNGREAYERISKIKPKIKTIFASGYTTDLVNRDDSSEGSVTFIEKPFTPEELLQKIRKILDA